VSPRQAKVKKTNGLCRSKTHSEVTGPAWWFIRLEVARLNAAFVKPGIAKDSSPSGFWGAHRAVGEPHVGGGLSSTTPITGCSSSFPTDDSTTLLRDKNVVVYPMTTIQ